MSKRWFGKLVSIKIEPAGKAYVGGDQSKKVTVKFENSALSQALPAPHGPREVAWVLDGIADMVRKFALEADAETLKDVPKYPGEKFE